MSETHESPLPQALDIEKAVLGACLLDSEVRQTIFRILMPEDFYSPIHKRIYVAMLQADERGYLVDYVTVNAQMKRNGNVDENDDANYLVTLTEGLSTGANAVHHAHILLEMALRRDFINSSKDLIEKSHDLKEDIVDLIGEHTRFNNKINAFVFKNFPKDKSDHLAEYCEYLFTNQQMGVQRIPTCFPTLNKMLKGGLEPGGFSLVGGTPGTGKTSFMLMLAHHAAQNNVQCSFLEGEMRATEIFERLNGISTGADIHQIRKGAQFEALSKQFISDISGYPFELVITSERTLHTLIQSIKNEIHKGSKLVFVDYLQVFAAKGAAEKEFQEIKKVSEALRQLSLANGVHICVASSINRRPGDKGKLNLTHLYGSSGLGHDASLVMMLDSKQKDVEELLDPQRKTILSLVKNRNGARGDIVLKYYLDSQKMEEAN